MQDTYFYLPKEKVARLTKVYSPIEGQPLAAAPAAGTMIVRVPMLKDRAKVFQAAPGFFVQQRTDYLFLQMLANRGELNGKRILSRHTVDLHDFESSNQ